MTALVFQVFEYGNSRTISVPVPAPVGSIPLPPTPLSWPFKDPADILDFKIDLGPALNGVSGDSIETTDIEIAPNQAADLILENAAADGLVLIVWLSGGVNGVTYVITFNVVTLSGQTIGGSISLPVIALSGLSATTNPITTVTGDPLTDENGSPIEYS